MSDTQSAEETERVNRLGRSTLFHPRGRLPRAFYTRVEEVAKPLETDPEHLECNKLGEVLDWEVHQYSKTEPSPGEYRTLLSARCSTANVEAVCTASMVNCRSRHDLIDIIELKMYSEYRDDVLGRFVAEFGDVRNGYVRLLRTHTEGSCAVVEMEVVQTALEFAEAEDVFRTMLLLAIAADDIVGDTHDWSVEEE